MANIMDSSIIDRFEKEHADLERQIEEWRSWWRELRELGTPHFNEMGTRLQQLRTHLARHMSREETCEFLKDITLDDAHRQASADMLRQQHAELLLRLDELIRRLGSCEPEYSCWGDARQDFEHWLDDLHSLERREIQWMRALLRESRAEFAALRQND